jgi:predicted RNA-binding protein Jag
MAQKIASRVLESGQAEQIRRELNSYDRRIVHTAIADIDGVTTRSIGEGSMKTLEVMLDGASAEA